MQESGDFLMLETDAEIVEHNKTALEFNLNPALMVQEIIRLRATIARGSMSDECEAQVDRLLASAKELKAENERLRATIARVEGERDSWANQASSNEEKRWRLEQRIKRCNAHIDGRVMDLGAEARSGEHSSLQIEVNDAIIEALNAASEALAENPTAGGS